tara:strand:+ start:443 stop:805 length:363 start_codon:yes stop_codon:yes gene_type:complete
MFYEYLFIILFGAMALRGAQWVNLMQRQKEFMKLPFWTLSPGGHSFVAFSVLLLIFFGFLNGFLLDGFKGMFIVGISTWLGASILHIFFISWINILSPLAQFQLLWPAYFIYTIYNLLFV